MSNEIIKDYLGYELARNKANGVLYTRMVQMAYGSDIDVLIGHHITFERHGDITTENEIPSADCLMFDHEIMARIFGQHSMVIMQHLAVTHCNERDRLLETYLNLRETGEISEITLHCIETAGGQLADKVLM